MTDTLFQSMASLMVWMILLLVAAIMIATMYYIRKWGPGNVTRHIFCPERKVGADVTFVQEEGDFGHLRIVDVVKCSLFPGAPVKCDKTCRTV